MKKLFNLLFIVVIALMSVQCTVGDDIGDLYGRWKLEVFQTPSGVFTPDDVFIGFQGNVYSYYPEWKSYDWGMYEIKGDSMIFLPMQWETRFTKIGINGTTARFKILEMNENSLKLSRSGNDSIWIFKSFLR